MYAYTEKTMFDFKTELEKLKKGVSQNLIKPFEISNFDNNYKNEKLAEISHKIENIALQTEEIYDIIENNSPNSVLLKTFINICDLLEVYLAAADTDGSGSRKLREILYEGGITVLGEVGEKLNPEIHRVNSAESVDGVISEQILQIIQHGYSYENKIIRKAKVVVSK